MAIRLELDPDMRRARNGMAVLGATIRLTTRGPGTTAAAKDEPKPATITFVGAYVTEVRTESNPDLEPFARVTGTLALKGPSRMPVMVLDASGIDHDAPPPDADDAPPPFALTMAYDEGSFGEPPPADSPLTVLRLPDAPPGARYFEMGVALELDGASEAEFGVNDRLDVPLSTITFFDVQVLDNKDFPLDAEPFELRLFDGSTIAGVSDDEGRVKVNPVPKGRCVLTMPEVDQDPPA